MPAVVKLHNPATVPAGEKHAAQFGAALKAMESRAEAEAERPALTVLTDALTLTEFFDRWYLPVILAPRERSPETIKRYRESLAWWGLMTTDPPPTKDPQPATGLYSNCFPSDMCPGLNGGGCLSLQDADMVAFDGFCTILCQSEAQCQPKPNSPAITRCLNIDPMQKACFLECVSDADCPTVKRSVGRRRQQVRVAIFDNGIANSNRRGGVAKNAGPDRGMCGHGSIPGD